MSFTVFFFFPGGRTQVHVIMNLWKWNTFLNHFCLLAFGFAHVSFQMKGSWDKGRIQPHALSSLVLASRHAYHSPSRDCSCDAVLEPQFMWPTERRQWTRPLNTLKNGRQWECTWFFFFVILRPGNCNLGNPIYCLRVVFIPSPFACWAWPPVDGPWWC